MTSICSLVPKKERFVHNECFIRKKKLEKSEKVAFLDCIIKSDEGDELKELEIVIKSHLCIQ